MGPLKSLNCRKYNITLTDILVVLKLEGCVNTTIPSESCVNITPSESCRSADFSIILWFVIMENDNYSLHRRL